MPKENFPNPSEESDSKSEAAIPDRAGVRMPMPDHDGEELLIPIYEEVNGRPTQSNMYD